VLPCDTTAHNVYVENEALLTFIYEQDASKIMCLGTRQTNWGRVGLCSTKVPFETVISACFSSLHSD
jgi:hypothetical protein